MVCFYLMETDPKKLFPWDETIWETINNHSIAKGMTRQQVRMSWGQPKSIARGPSNDTETWVYGSQILNFVNDSLVSPESK